MSAHRPLQSSTFNAAANLFRSALLGVVCLLAAAAPAATRPNIVFIMADDLGKNLLSLYDLDEAVAIETPNIDRLAAEGVIFENAYASPVCLVTRAELVTGRYPFHNGMLGHVANHVIGAGELFLDPKYQRNFAALLKRAGYATALAGKWHGNNCRPGSQPRVLRAFGFDEWMLVGNMRSTYMFTHVGGQPVDKFPADILSDFAIDFIERNREQPFFVYYPMHLVHRPLVATPLKPDAATDTEKLMAMTEYADHLVGRLLRSLDALGLRDNTIIFFSGDNGTAVTRLRNGELAIAAGGKGTLTEAGINVPFIVSGGPVVRRGRTAELTDFTDVLPTLAEFAGVEVPASWAVDGVSIAPFLTGHSEDAPRAWIAAAAAVWPSFDGAAGYHNLEPYPPSPSRDRYAWPAAAMGVVVSDGRFKLWDYQLGPRMLFDLRSDPREERNLWDHNDPEASTARRRLLAVRAGLPRRPQPLRSDRVTLNYGLLAHWRFDEQTEVGGRRYFPDAVGGYDARYEPVRFTAGLRRVVNGEEAKKPLVISTRRAGEGPRIEVIGDAQPFEPGERRQIAVTASNLDSAEAYLVRLTYAGQGLGSRPDCSYRLEDRTSAVFRGVRSHTETFTVYGCSDAVQAGKFGGAMLASAAPVEAEHFIDFFARTGSKRQFRVYRRQSFTLSAWIRRAEPTGASWHLLRHAADDVEPMRFAAGLRRVIDGEEAKKPLVTTTRRMEGGPRIEVIGDTQPFELGERRQIAVTASNLDSAETYLVRLTYAGQGLGSRPDCTYNLEDRTSAVFRGVRSHTETFTVYGCSDAQLSAATLAFTVTPGDEVVLQLATQGGDANRVAAPLPPSAGWTHLVATWDGGDACGEAVVYLDGQAAARACLGNSWKGVPGNALHLGYLADASSPGSALYLDDVAVWLQVLTPQQVAALYALGNRLGYDAAAMDMLFNAPRDYAVHIGDVQWERVSSPGEADDIDLGAGVVVRPSAGDSGR